MNTEQRDTLMANCKLCGSQANVYDIPAFSKWITNHGCNYGRKALTQTPERNAAGIAYPSIQTQKEYWERETADRWTIAAPKEIQEQRDIGGNTTPDRIEANQDQYFS